MPVVTGIVVGRAGACLLVREAHSLTRSCPGQAPACCVAGRGTWPVTRVATQAQVASLGGYFVDLGPREACDAPRVGAALPTHTWASRYEWPDCEPAPAASHLSANAMCSFEAEHRTLSAWSAAIEQAKQATDRPGDPLPDGPGGRPLRPKPSPLLTLALIKWPFGPLALS